MGQVQQGKSSCLPRCWSSAPECWRSRQICGLCSSHDHFIADVFLEVNNPSIHMAYMVCLGFAPCLWARLGMCFPTRPCRTVPAAISRGEVNGPYPSLTSRPMCVFSEKKLHWSQKIERKHPTCNLNRNRSLEPANGYLFPDTSTSWCRIEDSILIVF